jgi:LmbE family N-acetylglucosaminyl deacetylase
MTIPADRFFEAVEALPETSFEALVGAGGLVVVAPHPDDESLGCGGLIAEAAARGRALRIVVVSDGTRSHPNSRRYPREALRDLREAEARAALAALGADPASACFLRLPDAAVPRSGAGFEAGVAAILAAAQDCQASAIMVTWAHDPHCDHQAAHAMAQAAARQAGVRLQAYPVWGHRLPPDHPVPEGAPRGGRLPIGPHLPAKRRAIAAHRSQTTPMIDDDPEAFCLDAGMLARFDRPFEIFLEA